MRLVGVHFFPPSPRPSSELFGIIVGDLPAAHFIAEFDWPGIGTVVAETAEGVWIEKESYYRTTKATAYVSYTPEEISELLGGPLWDSVPVAKQIWTFDRLMLELKLYMRQDWEVNGYIRNPRYLWDDSANWLDYYRIARQVGIEKRKTLRRDWAPYVGRSWR